jgi:exopolysaccharide biosynthesis predicted pyruvyltransferase EpsI/GR25 family glycosyltransferase involved in LPS biosynthesis
MLWKRRALLAFAASATTWLGRPKEHAICQLLSDLDLDAVMWIHREVDVQRYQHFSGVLHEIATCGLEVVHINGYNSEYGIPIKNRQNDKTVEEYGCLLSHLNAVETMVSEEWQRALILEDDASLEVEHLWYKLAQPPRLSSFPNDWNIVKLSYMTNPQRLLPNLYNVWNGSWSTLSYVINRQGVDAIMSHYDSKEQVWEFPQDMHHQSDYILFKLAKTYVYQWPLFLWNNDLNSTIHADHMPSHVLMKKQALDLWSNVGKHTATWTPIGQKPRDREVCLIAVKELGYGIFQRLIGPGVRRVGLFDAPTHFNLGDSFISYGEQLFGHANYDFEFIQPTTDISRLDVVLLHGGGNFGDLWRLPHGERQNFVGNHSAIPLILMPQSVHYQGAKECGEWQTDQVPSLDEACILKDAAALKRHLRLKLTGRDWKSFDFFAKYYGGMAEFAPDAALLIGPTTPWAEPVVDVLVLARMDKERTDLSNGALYESLNYLRRAGITFQQLDWHETSTIDNATHELYVNQSLPLSEQQLRRFLTGKEELSRGKIVMTDRLHASILATMIGRPVVYVDQHYGKIANVRHGAFSQESMTRLQTLWKRRGRNVVWMKPLVRDIVHNCGQETLRAYQASTYLDAAKKIESMMRAPNLVQIQH